MPNKPIINLGIAPDTGTGDSARRGGEKINNLLVDTYTLLGDNAFVLDNMNVAYGTRSTFVENSFMVGELHPAGRWQRVIAQDQVGAIGLRSDNSNANIFYASRGEHLSFDLFSLGIESDHTDPNTPQQRNNRFQIILPLAREGDVVRIRDVNTSWGATGTRSQATGIDVWTTPFNYQGTDSWEWGERVTGTASSRPGAAHTNINGFNRSRSTVSGNGNTPIVAAVLGPLHITTMNADLEFIYGGHTRGWIVNEIASFNQDIGGNSVLNFNDSDDWFLSFSFDSNGDSESVYSIIWPFDAHTKGTRPIVQVEERVNNVFRRSDIQIDVVADPSHVAPNRDTGNDVSTVTGDVILSVNSVAGRFIGRIIASQGV